jgi:hypothetical protein
MDPRRLLARVDCRSLRLTRPDQIANPDQPGPQQRAGFFILEIALTEFAQETRHYCRNPRCRSKLSAPIANLREAFCARGCHTSFYRKRCVVCEGPIERKSEHQKLCRKSKCRNALNRGLDLGRYQASSIVSSPPKKLDSIDSAAALKPDRVWRIVAGPELSPTSFRFATLPLDDATQARVARDTRAIQPLSAKAVIQRHHMPVNLLGGYPPTDRPLTHRAMPDPVIDLSPIATAPKPMRWTDLAMLPQIPDDLSIPAFLRRGAAQ